MNKIRQRGLRNPGAMLLQLGLIPWMVAMLAHGAARTSPRDPAQPPGPVLIPAVRPMPVILDEMGIKNLQLETAEAEEADFEETVFALGRIKILPGKRFVLSSRIPGRAKRVLAYPDTEVAAGVPLVVVESRQPGDPPPEITLVAPAAGWITELAIAPGEPVNPDKALLAVVDLSAVHAVARVPEHLAHRIRPGQRVRVTAPGWPGESWETEVAHLGVDVDPISGTLEAACHVRNEGTWLRPGMLAEFHFVTRRRQGVLSVPRGAVLGDGAQRFVYRTDDELKNAFVKAPVVVGAANDRVIEILEGLFSGDEVVTHGGYALSFAGRGGISLKEALDAAHGHPHNEDGSEMTAEQGASRVTDGKGTGQAAGPRSQFTPLAWVLAGTSALLFALLLVSNRQRSVASVSKNRTVAHD